MKHQIVLASLLTLVGCRTTSDQSGLQSAAPSAGSAAISCHAVKGSVGDLSITPSADGETLKIKSNFQPDSESPSIAATCKATKDKKVNTFVYFSTPSSAACAIDAVRVPANFVESGKGLVALVKHSGGDTHDSSGYQYGYFYCGEDSTPAGADDGDTAGAPTPAGAATPASIKKAFEKLMDEGTNNDGKPVKKSALADDALKYFNQMNADNGPDYPPVAKVLKIKNTDVYVIETDTDGGTYIGLFYTNGKEIADGSASESGEWGWN